MQLLNNDSFTTLLTNCSENTDYKSAIMFSNHRQLNNFVEELHRDLAENGIPHIERITTRNFHSCVEFDNGSEIELFTLNNLQRIRGRHMFNEALLDPDILDFEAINVLEGMITEYTNTPTRPLRHRRSRTFDSYFKRVLGTASDSSEIEFKVDKKSEKILDDFLSSFKIDNSLNFGA